MRTKRDSERKGEEKEVGGDLEEFRVVDNGISHITKL
jgi:hypothetical protein